MTKQIYMASDGTEFDDEMQMEDHEEYLQQCALERAVEEKLGIKFETDLPLIVNDESCNQFCRLFLIKDEADLDLFYKAFDDCWFSNTLAKNPVTKKETFIYPQVLCFMDYPTEENEWRVYSMTKVCEKLKAFTKELDDLLEVRLKEK